MSIIVTDGDSTLLISRLGDHFIKFQFHFIYSPLIIYKLSLTWTL